MDESTETKPTLEVWVEDTDYVEVKDEKDGDSQYFEIIKMEADDDTLGNEQQFEQSEEDANDCVVDADDDETLAEEQLNELNSRQRERKRNAIQKSRNSVNYYPASLSQRDKQFMNHRKSVLSAVRKTTTTRMQYQRLLDLMQSKPAMAQSFAKCSKEEVFKFWNNAAKELNSLGPPAKDITSWKKVWLDWKSYIKRKLFENKKDNGATSYKKNSFNEMEEAVIKLTLQANIKSITGAVEQDTPGPVTSAHIDVLDSNLTEKSVCSEDQQDHFDVSKRSERKQSQHNINFKYSQSATTLLCNQIELQKEFYTSSMEVYQKMEKRMDEISVSLNKMQGYQEKLFEIEKEKLAERKRHNRVCEELLAAKNKIKLKMLELEESRV